MSPTIPKTIYFTWISEQPVPEKYKKYIDSWSKVMPDYEVKQISLQNARRGKFVNKAIEMKNYALAGHYARVQELYDNGGIYFDTDIEAIKPLDYLLKHALTIGMEDQWIVNNAVIIARKGHEYLKECMDYMDGYDFNSPDIELETGPRMFTHLMRKRGWKNGQVGVFGDVTVLPPVCFYPYHHTEVFRKECIKEYTYTVHHWDQSWRRKNKTSVVIPGYTQGQHLSDTIGNILGQDYKDVEITFDDKKLQLCFKLNGITLMEISYT